MEAWYKLYNEHCTVAKNFYIACTKINNTYNEPHNNILAYQEIKLYYQQLLSLDKAMSQIENNDKECKPFSCIRQEMFDSITPLANAYIIC